MDELVATTTNSAECFTPAEQRSLAEWVLAARDRLNELAAGVTDRDLLLRLERMQASVEAAERRVEHSWLGSLAFGAKRKLAKAQAAEEALEVETGLTWSALQIRRLDVLVDGEATEKYAAAERQHTGAMRIWRDAMGDLDPVAVLAGLDAKEQAVATVRAAGPAWIPPAVLPAVWLAHS
jgi:hypothetical protein